MSERDLTLREFTKSLRPGDSLNHDGREYGVVSTQGGYRVRPVAEFARERDGAHGEEQGKAGDASD